MVIDIFHRCIQIIDEGISDSKEGESANEEAIKHVAQDKVRAET